MGGIVPHAGWYFSGDTAALTFLSLKHTNPDIIVLYGGHLSQKQDAVITAEDACETPLGDIEIETNITKELINLLELKIDIHPDNTIEVQLPFLKYFFSKAKLLALRVAPNHKTINIGEKITSFLKNINLNFISIGSSDLTHYGPNYDFEPQGSGKKAVDWVKKVNDRQLIEYALKMQLDELLKHALSASSACSAGAIAAVISAAKTSNIACGKLLEYKTSYDVMANNSFVGYASIVF